MGKEWAICLISLFSQNLLTKRKLTNVWICKAAIYQGWHLELRLPGARIRMDNLFELIFLLFPLPLVSGRLSFFFTQSWFAPIYFSYLSSLRNNVDLYHRVGIYEFWVVLPFSSLALSSLPKKELCEGGLFCFKNNWNHAF